MEDKGNSEKQARKTRSLFCLEEDDSFTFNWVIFKNHHLSHLNNNVYIPENVALKGKLPCVLDGHCPAFYSLWRETIFYQMGFSDSFHVPKKRVAGHASIAGYVYLIYFFFFNFFFINSYFYLFIYLFI